MGLHPIDKYAWKRGGGVWWPAILIAVHGTRLDHVLFSGLRRENTPLPLHLDFVKADGDGPEGLWLGRVTERKGERENDREATRESREKHASNRSNQGRVRGGERENDRGNEREREMEHK